MGNPVLHFEVQAKDAAAAQKFYGEMFDWKIDASNPMNYGIVDTGGEGIAGGIGPAAMGDGGVTFYVAVPDLAEALARAEQLGATKLTDPMDVPGGPSIAHFADPEGNMIGLLKA